MPNRFRHKSPNSSIPGAQCLTNSIFQNIKNNARPFRSFCRRQRGAHRPHLSKWTVEVNIFANVRAEETVRFLSTVSADGAIVLGTELAVDEVCALRKAPMPVVILDTYYGHLRPAGRAHRRRTRPSSRKGPDRRRTRHTRQRASKMRYMIAQPLRQPSTPGSAEGGGRADGARKDWRADWLVPLCGRWVAKEMFTLQLKGRFASILQKDQSFIVSVALAANGAACRSW